MRNEDFDKTKVRDDLKLNRETIRQYEDPEYKKMAEEYEKQAAKGRTVKSVVNKVTKNEKSHAKSFKQATKEAQRRGIKKPPERVASYRPGVGPNIPEYDESTYKNFRKKNKKRKFNKKKIIRNIIMLLIILLVAVIAYFLFLTSHLDKVDTSDADFAIDNGVASDLKGYRNIAILGVDARKGEGYDGSRTDAIIIMRIKKSNGDIQLISVMRDSYLKMIDNDGNLILDKITHAHHYGGGVDTCAALNRSLDLNIDEFVIFNWQAVSDTVDCLGGIEVNVKKNEIADLNKWGPETAENVGGTYKKITKTGKQTIDGIQATTYCRIRKTSGGDTGRGNRYKKIMSAVIKKAIGSPIAMNKLAKEVLPEIRTNMSQGQMLSAVARLPGYSIKKSYGWPKKYYGGLLANGIWYAVPKTLEGQVKILHKKAFEQNNYTVSDTCKEISNQIIYYTGIQ